MTSTRTVARNTLLTMLGQVIPMIAAVIGIPILLHHLGASRFGVLTLAWAAIGYFGLFDLGLGRALTQAVALRLGLDDGRRDLGELAWTALWIMLILGIIGGVLLALLTPWIVRSGLHVPLSLASETVVSFYLLALSLPFVVTSAGLRGLLEAHQHFGVATALRIPLAIFTFIGPLAVLPFTSSLVPVVSVLVVGRILTCLAYLVVCVRRYDYLRAGIRLEQRAVAPLLRTGGWMTVSNVVSPLMQYVDRFFVGAILPLAAVAHYVTPYEIVTKLLVLPQAMVTALFPAFASTFAQDREHTALLFERGMRAVLLFMFPLILTIVLFAREGLTVWVGADFARESAPVLRWLAVGVFFNALAHAPFAVVQGTGRADLTAKLHLAELPVYATALWMFAHRFGIEGVAMAWTLRVALDTLLLIVLVLRNVPETATHLERPLTSAVTAVGAFAAAAMIDGTVTKSIFLAAMFGAFALLGWSHILRPAERNALRELRLRTRRSAVPPA